MENVKYKHALALYPYLIGYTTGPMGIFPPTGLEYIAASMKEFVGKVTFLGFFSGMKCIEQRKKSNFLLLKRGCSGTLAVIKGNPA